MPVERSGFALIRLRTSSKYDKLDESGVRRDDVPPLGVGVVLQLFLSYAHQDAERVRKFATDLRRPEIDPWMDYELKLAGRWNDEIDTRIAASNLILLIMSRATEEGDRDRFFRKEWALAFEARRLILPVRLEDCKLPATLAPELSKAIDALQRADLFPSYEEGLRGVLRFLYETKRTGVFEETFSCLGPDNLGWRLDGWQLDDADRTGQNSRSVYSTARLSPMALLPQRVAHTAAIDIDLPGRALTLRYRRRIALSAQIGGSAEFQVVVDGEVVDAASHENPPENNWTTRAVPIPDRGGRRASLELTVSASCNMNYFPTAEVWVDDLRIA
jgi:hypothetical protein